MKGSQMSETKLGEVSRDADAVVLRYLRRLDHPRELVWRAITESEHLRHWFPADLVGERREGAELKIPFWPEAVQRAGAEIEASGLDLDDAVLPGRILVWDPPAVFSFTWDTEELRFDLHPREAGTLLEVTVRVTQPAPAGNASTATGYHLCLDALVDHVTGRETDIFDATGRQALEDAYAARL